MGKLACGPSQPAQQQLPDDMRRSPDAFRAPKLASSQLPAKRASSTLVSKCPAGPWIARVLVGRARAQHARTSLENAVPPHEKVVSRRSESLSARQAQIGASLRSAHALHTRCVRAAPPTFDRNIVPPEKNGSHREHIEQRRTHQRSTRREGANGCLHARTAVV